MDECEAAVAVSAPDFVEGVRELLDRRDDDLLSLLDEGLQVGGAACVPDRRFHLRVLPDRAVDLAIEDRIRYRFLAP